MPVSELDRAWARAGELSRAGRRVEALAVYVEMAQELLSTRDSFPPVELMMRIARACAAEGERVIAIRILAAVRDAAMATGTAAARGAGLRAGAAAAHVSVAAGDVPSARFFLVESFGDAAVDDTDFDRARDAWSRTGGDLLGVDAAIAAGRYWAACGRFVAADRAFEHALAMPHAAASVLDAFYSRSDLRLRRIQVLADGGRWTEAEKAVGDDSSQGLAGRIVTARMNRQRGRLSRSRSSLIAIADEAARSGKETLEVQARFGLVGTFLVLNRLLDAEAEIEHLVRAADRGHADRGLLAFLASAARRRREAAPDELAIPAVPEQAWDLPDDTSPPPGAFEPGSSERTSERFVDDWSRLANAVLVAASREDVAAARKARDTLDALTSATDSSWLLGRADYYRAIVDYQERDYASAHARAASALRSAKEHGLPIEAWQAAHLVSWCAARSPNGLEYERAAAEARAILDGVAAQLDADDRAWFLLNKWSARDEYITSHLRRALAPVRSRAPLAALRAWLERRGQRRQAAAAHEVLVSILDWDADRRMGLEGRDAVGPTPETAVTPNDIDIWMRAQLRQLRSARIRGRGTRGGARLLRGIDRRSAVIQLYVSPIATYAFVCWRGEIRLLRSDTTRVAIDERVKAWRRAVAEQAMASSGSGERAMRAAAAANAAVATAGASLSQALGLEGALSLLPPGVDRLRLVPHDVLADIPWAALPVGGAPLCQRWAVSVHPSLSWIDLRGSTRPSIRRLAVVSVSRFPGRGLRDLPMANEECGAIADMFPGSVRLTDEAATCTAAVEAFQSADWSHVATHGHFDMDSPFRSRIVLAGPDQAGDMTVESLRGVDLRNLRGVVLSACEASLAAVLPGQQLVGLPTALLYAGVREVISPLWTVKDQASAAFMKDFYVELKSAPAIDALARVQRRWAAGGVPSFALAEAWAGYVLFGN